MPISRTPDSDSSNSNPSWSPDARNIAFVSSQETGRAYHVMSALGGEARRVMATANDTMLFGAPQWLSGGAELAGVAEDGTALEIFELATRQSRRLTLPVEAKGTVDWSWSPDGRLLAYVDAVSRPAQTSRIWMMRLDDDQAFPVTEGGKTRADLVPRRRLSLLHLQSRRRDGSVGSRGRLRARAGRPCCSHNRGYRDAERVVLLGWLEARLLQG